MSPALWGRLGGSGWCFLGGQAGTWGSMAPAMSKGPCPLHGAFLPPVYLLTTQLFLEALCSRCFSSLMLLSCLGTSHHRQLPSFLPGINLPHGCSRHRSRPFLV